MAKVTYSPNPLAPKDGQIIKNYDEEMPIGQILDDLKAHNREFLVSINGHTPEKLEKCHPIKVDDTVTIKTVVNGGEDTGKILSGILIVVGIILTIVPGTQAIGVNLIIAGATGLVGSIIAKQQAKKLRDGNGGRKVQGASAYSLNAASNGVRPYEPLMLTLSGRGHRSYPDYNENPYGGFEEFETVSFTFPQWNTEPYTVPWNDVQSGGGIVRVDISQAGSNPAGASAIHPYEVDVQTTTYSGGAGPWNQAAISSLLGVYTYYDYNFFVGDWLQGTVPYSTDGSFAGDRDSASDLGSPICLNFRAPLTNFVLFNDPMDPWNGKYATLLEFRNYLAGGAAPTLYNQGTGYTIVNSQCWRKVPNQLKRRHQKIYHVFNFGFGDLDITDDRVANTELVGTTSYLNVTLTNVLKNNTNWGLIPAPTLPITAGLYPHNAGNAPFGNVDTIEGGKLQNNEPGLAGAFTGPTGAAGLTNFNNYNWINREGPETVNFIEIDVEGRLFRQDPKLGVIELTRYYQFQYRLVGAASWSVFPATAFVQPLVGFDTFNYRRTFASGLIGVGKYEVRCRRVTRDEADPNLISDLNVSAIRFFQIDPGNYVAENRKGVEIVASGQINGNINRYSAYVRNKCWVYNSGTDSYNWGYSSNPADLYLYFCRGGWYNSAANGSLTYPYSPTVGWMNNADHPNNRERMFGAGLSDARIDFVSLKRWWLFCNARGLTFDAVVNTNQTCFEILSQIGVAGRASPTWQTGKLGVVIEDPDQQPVAMFGMYNIKKGSFAISYQNENLADEIRVSYIDRDKEWANHEVSALMPGVTASLNVVTIDFTGVTDESNAQREANLQAARQYYSRRTITFETDIEGLVVSRGDIVQLQHDLAQWDFSGRIVSYTDDGTNVTSFKLSCEPKVGGYCMIRYIDGDLQNIQCTVSGNVVTLIDTVNFFPLTEAPFYKDQDLTENTSSLYASSVPEDIMVFVGATQTPGKRVRINQITPIDNNTVKIVCIDEEPAIYAREFDDLPGDLPWLPESDYTKICARVFNICVEQLGGGKVCVSWETDGAVGAEVFATVGALPTYQVLNNGTASHFGNKADIQFSSGDNVTININPYTTGTPFTSESDSITFVVE